MVLIIAFSFTKSILARYQNVKKRNVNSNQSLKSINTKTTNQKYFTKDEFLLIDSMNLKSYVILKKFKEFDKKASLEQKFKYLSNVTKLAVNFKKKKWKAQS